MDFDGLTLIVLLLLGLVTLVTLLIDILALMVLLRLASRTDDVWREIPENRQAVVFAAGSLKELVKRIEEQTSLLQYIWRREG